MEKFTDLLAAATAKDAEAAAHVAAARAVQNTGLDHPAVWEVRGLWNSRSEVPPALRKDLQDLATELSRAVAGGEETSGKAARQETATRALLAAIDGDAAAAISLALEATEDPAFLEEAIRANLTPDPEA